jgi:hypothetical protein
MSTQYAVQNIDRFLNQEINQLTENIPHVNTHNFGSTVWSLKVAWTQGPAMSASTQNEIGQPHFCGHVSMFSYLQWDHPYDAKFITEE